MSVAVPMLDYTIMANGLEAWADQLRTRWGMSVTEMIDLLEWDRIYPGMRNPYGECIASTDYPGYPWRETMPLKVWTPRPQVEVSSAKLTIADKVRWAVWERDDFTCCHCGKRRYLTVDHITPESKGGLTILANLQTLCKSCNSRKGVKP